MDQYETQISQQIHAASGRGVDKSEILWAVVDLASALSEGLIDSAGLAKSLSSMLQGSHALQGLQSLRAHKNSKILIPNPWFVWNGHEEHASPETKHYLTQRTRSEMKSHGLGAVGKLASLGTVVDVASVVQNTNASASSLMHLNKFKALAKSHQQSQTIAGWLDVLLLMKQIKTGLRTGQLGLAIISAIPFGGAAAFGIASSLGANLLQRGIRLKYAHVCLMTAISLHWRAFQEQAISQHASGPATRILNELFVRRGMTRFAGQHNVQAFIREPAGWLAVNDKLTLV
ncbi:MAG: hypothetical protein V4623_05335 [Pseudomonadota bacterium]